MPGANCGQQMLGSTGGQPVVSGSLPDASAQTRSCNNGSPSLGAQRVRGRLPRTAGWQLALPGTGARLHFGKSALLAGAIALFITSCIAPDKRHRVVISVPDQQMALLDRGVPIATYPISTSKFGLGDWPGSNGTPLGELEVARKIGSAAPSGAVFKSRQMTGEIVPPDAPGRDPIVSRILWLKGREPGNANAYNRFIYIHGTPEERNIGRPVSYGCVRMRSRDVIELYDIVGRGAQVSIVELPLVAAVPALAPPIAQALPATAVEESSVR